MADPLLYRIVRLLRQRSLAFDMLRGDGFKSWSAWWEVPGELQETYLQRAKEELNAGARRLAQK